MESKAIIDHLSLMTALSPVTRSELSAKVRTESLRQRQIWWGEHQNYLRLFFVDQGLICRYYYNDEGRQIVTGFFQKGDLYLQIGSSAKIHHYFEGLYDSRLESIDLPIAGLEKNPNDLNALIIALILETKSKEDFLLQLLHMPALERYLRFRTEFSKLFMAVPLRLIASYLSMTRENLSRLINKG